MVSNEQAIKKFRPFILAEIEGGHLKKFGNSLKEAEAFFRDISYDFFRCVEGDFFQVSDIGKDSNYFFIPREKVKAVVNSLNQSQPGSFSKRQK